MQGRRKKRGGGVLALYYFSEQYFFQVKSKNIRFLHANNMWDFSLFIEQEKVTKNR